MDVESGGATLPPSSNNNENNNPQNNKDEFFKRVSQNRFSEQDLGPFFIFVEGKSCQISKTHPMVFGRWLFQSLDSETVRKSDITNVRVVGSNRMKVEASSRYAANKLVRSQCFIEKGLVAYIPDFLISKTGVVRGVDTDISEEEILREIVSTATPTHVRRLTIGRKDEKTGSTYRQKIQTCFVTFQGQKLPQYISIYGARCRVEPYVPPVRQCAKCFRIGHVAAQCRSKEIRCLHCAGPHDSDSPDCQNSSKTFCINCSKDDHKANSRTCPIYQDRIKAKREQVMADTYAAVTQNRFSVLALPSEDHPPLPEPTSPLPQRYKTNLRNTRPQRQTQYPTSTGRPAGPPPPTVQPKNTNSETPYMPHHERKKMRTIDTSNAELLNTSTMPTLRDQRRNKAQQDFQTGSKEQSIDEEIGQIIRNTPELASTDFNLFKSFLQAAINQFLSHTISQNI